MIVNLLALIDITFRSSHFIAVCSTSTEKRREENSLSLSFSFSLAQQERRNDRKQLVFVVVAECQLIISLVSVSREDDSVDVVILLERCDLFGSNVQYQHRARCDVLLSLRELLAVRSGNQRRLVRLDRATLMRRRRRRRSSQDIWTRRESKSICHCSPVKGHSNAPMIVFPIESILLLVREKILENDLME